VRPGEQGLVRGCCLGVVLLVGLAVAFGFFGIAVLSRPDLGSAPSGARHGGTVEAIAAGLAVEIGRGLVTSPHAVVVLSERDLTVVARARNPRPGRFRDPEARSRDGLVAVSAVGSLGPVEITTTARVRVRLNHGAGEPHLTTEVVGLEAGRLPIPGWARELVDNRGADALSVDSVLDSNPALRVLRENLDCVVTAPDGIRLGIHRPGTTADPDGCATLSS